MSVPEISVIIPVYNSEEFLSECINSILSQSFKNFEIILINDGSSDSSGKICDSYAISDSRVRVYHKVNGGVSSARNLGLSKAKGNYICFIDADDWIESDCFSESMKAAKEFGSDIIQYGYLEHHSNGNHKLIVPPVRWNFNKIDFYHQSGSYQSAVWGFIIKKTIIENNLAFPDKIKYGEDQEFILKALFYAQNITTLNKQFYFYRENINSATQKELKYEMASDLLLVVNNLISFFTENGKTRITPFFVESLIRLIKAYLIKVAEMPIGVSLLLSANKDFRALCKKNSKLVPTVFSNPLFQICKINILPYIIYIKYLLHKKRN